MTKSPRYNKKAVDKQLTRNGVTKPKAKKLTHKFLKGHQKADEAKVQEAGDVVNFNSYAGMYADGAYAVFKGRDGKMHKLVATGDVPREYTIDGQPASWDEVQAAVGSQKLNPRRMHEDAASDYGVSDADRNPSMARSAGKSSRPAAKPKPKKYSANDPDAFDRRKRDRERAMFGESQLNEGVLDDADDDGFMAKRQLYDIAKYAVELHRMIQDTDNLEPWVQAKITKAQDYIDTVKHYLEYQDVQDAGAMADFSGMDDLAPAVDAMEPEGPVEPAPEEMMEFEDEGFTGADLLHHAVLRGIVGPDSIHDAAMQGVADDTAEWYFADAEEIGSSDISIALKSFAKDCAAQGCTLDGANAQSYLNEANIEERYKRMLAPLKGRK